MSKRWLVVFSLVILFLGSQAGFAATITKEFSFELAPGEASKSWEINIPLPASEKGQFIGRDFIQTNNNPAYFFQVIKENLTEKNYYAKIGLLQVASSTSLAAAANFQVSLQVGSEALNDTPKAPSRIKWNFGNTKEIEWEGWTPDDQKGDFAKYLIYSVKIASTDEILSEQIVPIYLTGPRFPIFLTIPPDKEVVFSFYGSNVSAKASQPKICRLKIGKNFGL